MKTEERIVIIYNGLNDYFGDLKWWPAKSSFEVIVGAILTQNTSWANVEKAIANLKSKKLLSPVALSRIDEHQLADLIRPSGYYNIKARRLRHFLDFLTLEYQNNLKKMFSEEIKLLREKLLSVSGIGEETADSILLYAGKKPVFVVDAYTRRIAERHALISAGSSYGQIQRLFAAHLPSNVILFNQFHALIVNTGKFFCRKTPRCESCPIKDC